MPLALNNCSPTAYPILDLDGKALLATCYADMMVAFCRVQSPPGTTVISANSPTQTILNAAEVGSAFAGMGADVAFIRNPK